MLRDWTKTKMWFFVLAAGIGLIAGPYVVRILLEKQRYPSLSPDTEPLFRDDDFSRRPPAISSDHNDFLIHWAEKSMPLEGLDMKVDGPCVLIAKLLTSRDVEGTNQFLQSLKPWSATGSEWDLREMVGWQKSYSDKYRFGHRGDYDFTETGLVSLLYLLTDQPDKLYPKTAEYIAKNLLTSKGGDVQWCVPGSFGLVTETENHLLMTESSRYLANQWLRQNGNTDPKLDNAINGLETWLTGYLTLIVKSGFHEYNSNPYQGFALHALLNLEAFSDRPEVAALARQILDREARNYAFSSLRFRRVAPFRRRLEYASREIFDEPLSLMMSRWSTKIELPEKIRTKARDSSFGLLASVLPYRPTEAVLGLLDPDKSDEYFLRIGRGSRASPEIYSSGPEYLISAGGLAYFPLALTQTAIRPTTLLLDDGAANLNQCIRLANKNTAPTNWNNTGVAPRFACGDAPVIIPENFIPVVYAGDWCVIRPIPGHNLLVVTYSKKDLGIIAVFPGWTQSPKNLLDAVTKANPEADLRKSFVFPDSRRFIEYDVNAPKTQWVIVADEGVPTERDTGTWPTARFGSK